MPDRVLVTGASGFVGASLVRYLCETAADVHALVRDTSTLGRLAPQLGRISLHRGDIADEADMRELFGKVKPAITWHAAAHGATGRVIDDGQAVKVNCLGLAVLLRAADNANCSTFINLGSSSEYGEKHEAMDETMREEPTSLYACTKLFGTRYAITFRAHSAMRIFSVRLFSPFGALDARERLIPTIIDAIVRGQTVRLSRPTFVRDFIYMHDVYDCLVRISEGSERGGLYNLGSGVQSSISDVVRDVEALAGKKLDVSWNDWKSRINEPAVWRSNQAKTAQTFGWKPRYSLRDGLSEMLAEAMNANS